MALGQDLRDQVRANGHVADDISSLTRSPPSRSALVAAVLNHGIGAMQEFARHGFAPLLEEYLAADTLRDCPVTLSGSAGPTQGIARGVDEDGALRVEHDGVIHRIMAGEVSVRTA